MLSKKRLPAALSEGQPVAVHGWVSSPALAFANSGFPWSAAVPVGVEPAATDEPVVPDREVVPVVVADPVVVASVVVTVPPGAPVGDAPVSTVDLPASAITATPSRRAISTTIATTSTATHGPRPERAGGTGAHAGAP